MVLVQELTNSSYQSQLLNLADQDTEREKYKNKVIQEIAGKREQKLNQVRQIIINAQTTFAKNEVTKQELEKAVNELKNLSQALSDSARKIVWTEKETENQKLLSALEEKLNKFTPPEKKPNKENLPPPPTSNQPSTPAQKKVWGLDWDTLKLVQQQIRQEIVKKWEKLKFKTNQESLCSYCKKAFAWDKNLTLLEAKNKSLAEIENHQKTCPLKNNSNQVKKITQELWEETRKTKTRNFYSCPHCLEKIVWDKNIGEVELAEKQALADFNLHCKECHKTKQERTLKTLSQNHDIQHAPLSYAQEVDRSKILLERDDQGLIWQEQINLNNESTSWTPWLIAGNILIVSGFILVWWFFEKEKWALNKLIRKTK